MVKYIHYHYLFREFFLLTQTKALYPLNNNSPLYPANFYYTFCLLRIYQSEVLLISGVTQYLFGETTIMFSAAAMLFYILASDVIRFQFFYNLANNNIDNNHSNGYEEVFLCGFDLYCLND